MQGHDRYFDSAGVALCFAEAGAGAPVVLLHSYTGSFDRDYARSGLFAALGARFRAIGLDLRGHCKSGKPHDPRQYGREMALDVVRLLDYLHLPKAHLVGYSLGAHIVAQFLALHPQRFITATAGWRTRTAALVGRRRSPRGDRGRRNGTRGDARADPAPVREVRATAERGRNPRARLRARGTKTYRPSRNSARRCSYFCRHTPAGADRFRFDQRFLERLALVTLEIGGGCGS